MKKRKGLQTLPDKRGKVKQCNPEKSFPCGKACLSITSDILGRCQKNLLKNTQNQALKLLESMSSIKSVNKSSKLTITTTKEERDKFKNNVPKQLINPEINQWWELSGIIKDAILTEQKYKQISSHVKIQSNIGNPPYEEELVSLRHYTGSGFPMYNSYLRDNLKDTDKSILNIPHNKEKLDLDLSIKMAESALDSLPDYQGETYRSASLSTDVYDFYKNNVGKEIIEKGFLSTTKGIQPDDLIEMFDSHNPDHKHSMFIVKSKKGKSIKHISEFDHEDEVLFKPNSRFKVNSIDETSKNYPVIHLEEI